MKRAHFLLIAALLSLAFGTVLFFLPKVASIGFGMPYTSASGSLLRGMGGLIIGSGTINLLLKNSTSKEALSALFIANIVTHLFGISADIIGLSDNVLTWKHILPVEATHIFIGVSSLIYLRGLHKSR